MWEGLQQEIPAQCPSKSSLGGKALRMQPARTVENPSTPTLDHGGETAQRY